MMKQQRSLKPLLIYLITFAEGLVSIAVEILTIRQLLPFAGSSVIVTSLIIGVFLLFLAIGYHLGGQYTGEYLSRLRRNFTITAILLGLGLSYFFISLFFYFLQTHLHLSTLLVLLLYLLLITAPITCLLGQTIPITMNMMHFKKSPGHTGGSLLAVSTLGSFLGATVITLISLHFVGVAWTIVINFCSLIALSILLCDRYLTFLQQLVICLTSLGLTIVFNPIFEQLSFIKTNNYGNYEVIELKDEQQKLFVINNSMSSLLNKDNHGFPYAEKIKDILFSQLKLHHEKILIIGAGGFTLTAEGDNDNYFTYVDIDPEIKAIAEKNFNKKIVGEFVAADGRAFLRQHPKEFTVILSDVYSNRKIIPPQMLTQNYFQEIKQSLTENGLSIFNIIANPTLSDPYSKRIDNTLRSVFSNCMSIPLHYQNDLTNIIYLCNNNNSDQHVYTDNLNQATLDSINKL